MAIDEAVLGGRVGIDTSVLIAMADPDDEHHRISTDTVTAVLSTARVLVIPAIAYGEFAGADHEDLGRSSGIEVVSFDDVCARLMKAVQPDVWKNLPNGRQVAKVDVLIAISAKRHNVSLFVTNDSGQLRICNSLGLKALLAKDLESTQGKLL